MCAAKNLIKERLNHIKMSKGLRQKDIDSLKNKISEHQLVIDELNKEEDELLNGLNKME